MDGDVLLVLRRLVALYDDVQGLPGLRGVPERDEVVGAPGDLIRQLDVLGVVLDLVLLDRLQRVPRHDPVDVPLQQHRHDELHARRHHPELRADHLEQHALLDHGEHRRQRDRFPVHGQHLARQSVVLHGGADPGLLRVHRNEELLELPPLRPGHRRLGRRRLDAGVHCHREVLDDDAHSRRHRLLGVPLHLESYSHGVPKPPPRVHHLHVHRHGRPAPMHLLVDCRKQVYVGRGREDDDAPEVVVLSLVEGEVGSRGPQRDDHERLPLRRADL
mmetsp:Transcript_85154/g.238510  ORF Transcript_85154/g.238510 Transcript_85154/m.238510 type:complete len:274 (-) Transcript_85154:264-1085(-)